MNEIFKKINTLILGGAKTRNNVKKTISTTTPNPFIVATRNSPVLIIP